MAITDTSTLKPKTRIVATTKLPGVPEGTGGKLGRAIGLTLTRYRVAFDNGVDLNSVTHTHVVREDEWDELKADREAEAAALEAGAAEAEVDGAEPAAKAEPEAASSPTDDRLAALLAKSKAAKEKKQADA